MDYVKYYVLSNGYLVQLLKFDQNVCSFGYLFDLDLCSFSASFLVIEI